MTTADERVPEELSPTDAKVVDVFREAVRRMTGRAPEVQVYRMRWAAMPSRLSDVRVDVDGRTYAGGSTLVSVLTWALWCEAERACVGEVKP